MKTIVYPRDGQTAPVLHGMIWYNYDWKSWILQLRSDADGSFVINYATDTKAYTLIELTDYTLSPRVKPYIVQILTRTESASLPENKDHI